MSEIVTVEATVLIAMTVLDGGDPEITIDSLVKQRLKGMKLVPKKQTFWEWFWWSSFGAPFVSGVVRVKEIERCYAGGE